jgi:DNA-binding transcriptional ArsR family regulator
MPDKGQNKETTSIKQLPSSGRSDDFVLEKSIFSNIFDKDIKRVYLYKKAERLAKALALVAPAFRTAPVLAERLDRIAVDLIDAAVLPPLESKTLLARELLALSSILSTARVSGLLSPMNAELIASEARALLEEVAAYQEPRLVFEEEASLAELSRDALRSGRSHVASDRASVREQSASNKGQTKGQIKDNTPDAKRGGRREAVLSVLRAKGPSYIKDISTVIREVSEKTIQRELQALVEEGVVQRSGERRWTTYSLASA